METDEMTVELCYNEILGKKKVNVLSISCPKKSLDSSLDLFQGLVRSFNDEDKVVDDPYP